MFKNQSKSYKYTCTCIKPISIQRSSYHKLQITKEKSRSSQQLVTEINMAYIHDNIDMPLVLNEFIGNLISIRNKQFAKMQLFNKKIKAFISLKQTEVKIMSLSILIFWSVLVVFQFFKAHI